MTNELRRNAEELARADYQKALGQIVTVKMLSGYNESDDFKESGTGVNTVLLTIEV